MSDSGSEEEETLYDRIGGSGAVDAAVQGLYKLVVQDSRTEKFFSGTDVEHIMEHQKIYLAYALGASTVYDGTALREAHEALDLDDDDFDAVASMLQGVLKDLGIADDLVEEVMEIVAATKNDVLGLDEDGDGSRKKKQLVTVNYELESEHCDMLKSHFQWVLEAVGSLDDVGNAIYEALFTNAGPEGQKLFVSPKRATAYRFVTQVQRFVNQCDDIAFLDDELYNMGMRHIAYITPAQSKEYMPVFIGTITSVIKGVLDEEWDEDLGGDAWAKLLSYIGGMLIRNLSEFTGKVHMIRKSWATITQIQGQGTTGASHRSEHEDEDSDEDADATERGKKGKGADGSVNFGESLYFNLGVMSPEIAALFKRPKDQLAPMFGAGFASLTVLISDPNLLNEELYILGIRHLKYGTTAASFPVFGQAVMVTLRTLLPREWNWAHEDAWGWLWETCSTYLSSTIEQGHVNKRLIDDTMEKLAGHSIADMGHMCHTRLFSLDDDVQNHFYKPNSIISFILERALGLLSTLCHEPVHVAHEIRALGMRHIKYNIPPKYFPLLGKALVYMFATVLEGFWTDDIENAWLSVFDFVMRCMTRSVNEGSNLVTKAMVNNSVDEMTEVLKQAPRSVRDKWLLEVNVSGEILSPFYWALFDGKVALARFMLEDLMAIRADRETYYCGGTNLFITHPGVVNNLAALNPSLLPVLMDGLMWRSRMAMQGFRRVNYFIRDVFGDPTMERYFDPYHTPLAELTRLRDSDLFTHPVTQFLVDVKWQSFGRSMFIKSQAYFLVVLVVFMIAYVGFDYTNPGTASFDAAYYSRIVLTALNICILMLRQIPRLVQEIRRQQVQKVNLLWVFPMSLPVSLFKAANVVRLIINLLLLIAFASDNKIVGELFSDTTATSVLSWTTSFAAVLLWTLVFDLFTLEIRLAKVNLRISMIVQDLFVCLTFCVCLFIGFGGAMYLAHSGIDPSGLMANNHFQSAGESIVYLFVTFTGNYVFNAQMMSIEMQLFYIIFGACSVLFVNSILSAVSTTTLFHAHSDIEGITYLNRARELVELESMQTLEKRQDMWLSFNFTERIEFDEGDLGICGGLQIMEAVSKYGNDGKEEDRIMRFPGDASPKAPWPTSKTTAKSASERLENLDSMFKRIAKMLRDMRKKGKGGGVEASEASSVSEASN